MIINNFLLPIISLILPEKSIEIIAANEGELTTHPACISVKSNLGITYVITPEIIPVSKPKRKPPKPTLSEIKTICNLALKINIILFFYSEIRI